MRSRTYSVGLNHPFFHSYPDFSPLFCNIVWVCNIVSNTDIRKILHPVLFVNLLLVVSMVT